jgi:hypothetical protein
MHIRRFGAKLLTRTRIRAEAHISDDLFQVYLHSRGNGSTVLIEYI